MNLSGKATVLRLTGKGVEEAVQGCRDLAASQEAREME
jgi:hypothetical protein